MPVSISFYRTARSTAPSTDAKLQTAQRFHGVARHDRSRLSVGRRRNKTARAMTTADGEVFAAFEFFQNIWGASPHMGTRRGSQKRSRRGRRAQPAGDAPLIDISQVAHVVTTMTDFLNDYAPLPMQLTNLWDDPSLERPDTPPDEFMSPIHSHESARTRSAGFRSAGFRSADVRSAGVRSAEDETSCEDAESSFASSASSLSAPFRPSPEPLHPSHAAQVIYPAAAEASGAQLTKIKPHALGDAPPGAAPRALKDGGVVFSSAVGDPSDWTWAARLLLALHEPVRHALFVMDRFLGHCHAQYAQLEAVAGPAAGANASALALEAHVGAFFAWFKTCFVALLRAQHELKTRVLLPLVSLKPDAKREVRDRYRDAFQLVEQAQQLERALCVASGACSRAAWLRRLDVLRREVRTLHSALLGALALEDRLLPPALSNTFTELTFSRYVLPRLFRGVRCKRVLVPWVVERSKVWGGDREHAALLALLPFSAKLLYRKVWRPFFAANVAVPMQEMLAVADGGPRASSVSVSVSVPAAAAPAYPRNAALAAGRRDDRCGVQ